MTKKNNSFNKIQLSSKDNNKIEIWNKLIIGFQN